VIDAEAKSSGQDATTGRESLRAEGVSVSFSGLMALSGVDFTVQAGEIVGLIGPNGSGKTTLLNALSGFQRPSSGSVSFCDESILGRPPERLVRSGLGRTFQGVRPFGHLTVRENIEAGAVGVGASRRVARARASELLDELNLTSVASQWAVTLPAGSQRRLGIARAMAGDPKILLLDEPAAGLYEAETTAVVEFIGRIRATRGTGIALVEHDMSVVMRLCDRIQVLDHGITLAQGSPSEVRSDARVLEAYLGRGKRFR
jgi:ABC-type branched-subunit amino acid transport system ATPase component